MLHALDVLWANNPGVSGCGDEDVGGLNDRFEGCNLVAIHGGLKGANRVDFADDNASTLAGHGLGTALADVAVASDEHGLAADKNVGGAVQAVWQRVANAVLVVELGLGDRVIDVDCRKQQFAALVKLVEAVHARGGLF